MPPSSTGSGATTGPTRTDAGWADWAQGCSNFIVWVTNADKQRFLVIRGQKEQLGLSKAGDSATIQLENSTKAADLQVDVYPRAGGDKRYCTDVFDDQMPEKSATWKAVSGSITFTITSMADQDTIYLVTVSLANVIVESPNGTKESIPDKTFSDVRVGAVPG